MMMEVRTISDISTLPFDSKHIDALKALVHQTDDVQINVYVLKPGGRIPAHRHTSSWDISVVLDGEIEAVFFESGGLRSVRCGKNAINVLPPGQPHEISNPSEENPATFVLIQSPSHSFDFVKGSS